MTRKTVGQRKKRLPKSVCSVLLLVSLSILLSGCLSMRTPGEFKYTNGVAVTSLSSNVALSYSSPGRSISGSGFLMYRKPDQLRAVILSPFGSVLQEVFVSGDMVTIIDAGNGIAFSGSSTELPDTGDFSGWKNIHWLIDIDTPDSTRGNSRIERVDRYGRLEKVSFENGLIVAKSSESGGDVTYGRYENIQGATFPTEIIYETVTKEKFTLRFEEPESNPSFADGAFTPNLSIYRVYPLKSLQK